MTELLFSCCTISHTTSPTHHLPRVCLWRLQHTHTYTATHIHIPAHLHTYYNDVTLEIESSEREWESERERERTHKSVNNCVRLFERSMTHICERKLAYYSVSCARNPGISTTAERLTVGITLLSYVPQWVTLQIMLFVRRKQEFIRVTKNVIDGWAKNLSIFLSIFF